MNYQGTMHKSDYRNSVEIEPFYVKDVQSIHDQPSQFNYNHPSSIEQRGRRRGRNSDQASDQWKTQTVNQLQYNTFEHHPYYHHHHHHQHHQHHQEPFHFAYQHHQLSHKQPLYNSHYVIPPGYSKHSSTSFMYQNPPLSPSSISSSSAASSPNLINTSQQHFLFYNGNDNNNSRINYGEYGDYPAYSGHMYPSHDYSFYGTPSEIKKILMKKKKSKNDIQLEERIGRITVSSVNADYTVWIPVLPNETGLSLAEKIRNIATMRTKRIISITSHSGQNIPLNRKPVFNEQVDINAFKDGEKWTVEWCDDDRNFVNKLISKISLGRLK